MKKNFPLLGALIAIAALGTVTLGISPLAHSQSNTEQVVASESSATFAIENMTCALCPITVRTAIEKVSGVKSVEIDFDAKTATVRFDPAVATTSAISEASTNAGYPAHIGG